MSQSSSLEENVRTSALSPCISSFSARQSYKLEDLGFLPNSKRTPLPISPMKTIPLSPPEFIAPCGIDCRLCRAFTRPQQACPGCRAVGAGKSSSCATCKIKNCAKLAELGSDFCVVCQDFPCYLIKRLDQRYRTKYAAQPIENLHFIRLNGLAAFIEQEDRQWTCPHCGARLCMHKPQCGICGREWRM